MPLPSLLAALAGVLVGAGAGWGGRVLLGRLRRGAPVRPPWLEVAGAVATGLGVALTWPAPTTGLVVWAGLLTVVLGAVDIAAHRLPDALTWPAIPITAGLILLTWLADPDTGRPLTALLAAAVVTAVFGLVSRLAPSAMGLGDVKLVPSLALLTGYRSVESVLWWLALAFLLGAVVALVGLALRRLTMKSAIPFGPCLLAACWAVLLGPG
jgi:leader peptidase (prepilin peptidase)/N-methyltransferase